MLGKIAKELENLGLRTQRRLFFGNKSEDVIKIANNYEMLAISKAYGSEITKSSPLSPVVLKIIQHLEIPTIVY